MTGNGILVLTWRRLVALCLAGVLLLVMAGSANAAPDSIQRIEGVDRVATAVAVSQEFFDVAGIVVLARADDFPDALAAGPLAGVVDGPILLTPSDALDPRVASEIRRLKANRVYLIGGTAALSAAVETSVAALATAARLDGRNRFETALAVADEAATFREAGPAFGIGAIVNGRSFPDALAAINLSGFGGDGSDLGPDYIGLTPQDFLPGDDRVCDPSYPDVCIEAPPPDFNCDQVGFVGPMNNGVGFRVTGDDPHNFDTDGDGIGCESWSPLPTEESYIVVGGESAVSGNVERQLAYGKDSVRRVAGKDRYGTAAAALEVALSDRNNAPGPLFVATGAAFPDALSGGAAVLETGGYLALVTPDAIPAEIRQVLSEHRDAFTTVYVLGGERALSRNVGQELATLFGL